jgi:hypothetical protein
MSNQSDKARPETLNKPDSAGLWEREGKTYRVWTPLGAINFVVAEITDEGFELGKHAPPLGNWRKLTPAAASVPAEFSDNATFYVWAWDATTYVFFERGQATAIDSKGHERRIESMDKDDWVKLQQVSCGVRKIATPAAASEGHKDDIDGLKQIIELQRVQIEGLKQRRTVTIEQLEQIDCDPPRHGCQCGGFESGHRAAIAAVEKLITPPRPAFQAPPKPEPLYRLYRITRGDRQGQFYWGLPAGGSAEGKGADLFIDNQSNFHNFSWCEEVTETGEPIAKE